jgi:hypothetical protein
MEEQTLVVAIGDSQIQHEYSTWFVLLHHLLPPNLRATEAGLPLEFSHMPVERRPSPWVPIAILPDIFRSTAM